MDFDFLRTIVLATCVSQLVTMSIIAPRRIYLFRRELWTKYPPEQYPRLYPIGTKRLQRQQFVANVVDGVIVCLGTSLLIALIMQSAPTYQIAFFAIALGMVQILVRLPRWFIDMQIKKAYKAAQPPAIRSASLKHWTLWDFVSPAIVVLGIAATALGLCIAGVIALAQQGEAKLTLMIAIVMSMDAVLLFRMIRSFFQPLLPRIDPYATGDDLYNSRKRRLRILFIGSAVFSLVTSIELLSSTRFLAIRYEYIAVGLSLLMQFIALLISAAAFRQLRTRDFSAYRDSIDPSSSRANV